MNSTSGLVGCCARITVLLTLQKRQTRHMSACGVIFSEFTTSRQCSFISEMVESTTTATQILSRSPLSTRAVVITVISSLLSVGGLRSSSHRQPQPDLQSRSARVRPLQLDGVVRREGHCCAHRHEPGDEGRVEVGADHGGLVHPSDDGRQHKVQGRGEGGAGGDAGADDGARKWRHKRLDVRPAALDSDVEGARSAVGQGRGCSEGADDCACNTAGACRAGNAGWAGRPGRASRACRARGGRSCTAEKQNVEVQSIIRDSKEVALL